MADKYEITSKGITDVKTLVKESHLLEDEQDIAKSILAADSKEELQKQLDLFNLTQAKKNALRIIKLNSLSTKAEDEMDKRLNKANQLSNRDLLDYHNAVNTQIERSKNNMKEPLGMKDSIVQIESPSNHNNITVNLGTELNKDSKENVVNAIKSLMDILQNPEESSNPSVLPEMEENKSEDSVVEVVDTDEFIEDDSKNIVY